MSPKNIPDFSFCLSYGNVILYHSHAPCNSLPRPRPLPILLFDPGFTPIWQSHDGRFIHFIS